jgi:hypothetical protein
MAIAPLPGDWELAALNRTMGGHHLFRAGSLLGQNADPQESDRPVVVYVIQYDPITNKIQLNSDNRLHSQLILPSDSLDDTIKELSPKNAMSVTHSLDMDLGYESANVFCALMDLEDDPRSIDVSKTLGNVPDKTDKHVLKTFLMHSG